MDLKRCFVLLCPLLRFSILGGRCMKLIKNSFAQIDSRKCILNELIGWPLEVKINVWRRYISWKKKKSMVSKSLLLLPSPQVQSKKNTIDGIERNCEVFLFMIANHILKIWKTSISLICNHSQGFQVGKSSRVDKVLTWWLVDKSVD
jgi:hypothetical protein